MDVIGAYFGKIQLIVRFVFFVTRAQKDDSDGFVVLQGGRWPLIFLIVVGEDFPCLSSQLDLLVVIWDCFAINLAFVRSVGGMACGEQKETY